MSKYYKYSELNKEAQQKACQDYHADAPAWLKKEYTWQECHEFCMDTDEECNYKEDGSIVDFGEYLDNGVE